MYCIVFDFIIPDTVINELYCILDKWNWFTKIMLTNKNLPNLFCFTTQNGNWYKNVNSLLFTVNYYIPGIVINWINPLL